MPRMIIQSRGISEVSAETPDVHKPELFICTSVYFGPAPTIGRKVWTLIQEDDLAAILRDDNARELILKAIQKDYLERAKQ